MPLLTKRLKREEDDRPHRDPGWLYVVLFFATAYGGYFGGALGVILVVIMKRPERTRVEWWDTKTSS